MRNRIIITVILMLVLPQARGQQKPRHSLSTDPILPFVNSAVLLYGYQPSDKQELITGFWYSKTTATYPKEIPYPGNVKSYSVLIGYRRFFWRNLHLEYQLYPGYSRYHEDPGGKVFHSFSLFNELRFGYKFEFEIREIPLLVNLQWPVGFTLFESNEPDSFREVRRKDPVFYIFFPNVYLGFRF